LVRLLSGTGLIDENMNWTGGTDHLVVAGDFIDRGSGDRQVMDLLRQLQLESVEAGGRVHVLLGNHEVMNLFRDTRYVHPAAYKSFADDESKTERQIARRAFLARARGRSAGETLRRFNRKFPSGFFARQATFDSQGEYGNWLLEQPVIVKVNGVVFVHGGLSEEFAVLGVDGINRRTAAELRRHLESRAALENEGYVDPTMRLAEISAAAEKVVSRWRGSSLEARAASAALLAAANSSILKSRGPLWYRGNSFEDERIERGSFERSLELVGARAIVVAHSPTRGGKITSRFHGQLFRVDHGIGSSEQPLALVVERGEVVVLDPSNGERTTPVSELPPGDYHSSGPVGVSDARLQHFLMNSSVVDRRDLGRGSTRPQLVVLEQGGRSHRAVFKTVDQNGDQSIAGGADRYQHEVAAYLLDRRLGLNMVPVTVIRRIDGLSGSVQSWIERAVDQGAAKAYDLPHYNTTSVREQLALGGVFDALIGNHYRQPSDILLPLSSGKIHCIDHSRAFSISSELIWSPKTTLSLTPRLAAALRSLDRKSLLRDLGKLLNHQQIEALLIRRDKILAQADFAAQ
jgi:hypothetical protein